MLTGQNFSKCYSITITGLPTEPEIATAPLDGLILPGVTRDSILELAKNWVRYVQCT